MYIVTSVIIISPSLHWLNFCTLTYRCRINFLNLAKIDIPKLCTQMTKTYFLSIFTIYCIQIYYVLYTIKHFHVIAQIATKRNIMELDFQCQTLQIHHQNQNYKSSNQRNYLLPSCFVVEIKVSLTFSI